MDKHTFEATTAGQRVDKFLSLGLPDISRSAIVNLIESGNVLLNGKDTNEPEKVDAGSYENPIDVTTALQIGDAEDAWIRGFIVGYVAGDNISTAVFGADNATNLNFMIASTPNETDAKNCIVVQLPRGILRTGLNLKDNPHMIGNSILLTGNLVAQYGTRALTSLKYAEVNGQTYGTKP